MKEKNGLSLKNSFTQQFFSLFLRKQEPLQESDVGTAVTKEIDVLWCMVKKQTAGEQDASFPDCSERIINSFNELEKRFSDEQLDKAYAWLRYVKVALHCENPPVKDLVKHINDTNYIFLTKRFSDLAKSIYKGTDKMAIRNTERFYDAVCHHILDSIDPGDIPSCLALGRAAQRRKDYPEAKKWFEKVMGTGDPFNGVTALLACYEDEVKTILSTGKSSASPDPELMEKIRVLNGYQYALYEEWRCIMEKRINSGDEISDHYKREYVSLVTGYSRFERNRGDFDKALELLAKIPGEFPERYRVYTEAAMLYQFKPNRNRYYSLEKAIQSFQKAYAAVCEETDGNAGNDKSRKSILMPLANTYFKSGKYKEADRVCDSILTIDAKEQRAIRLKKQIAGLAS